MDLPVWHANHQAIFTLYLKLDCVWPLYNPALGVSCVYDHLHTACFGKSGYILCACLHVLLTGPVAVAHVSLLLIVNED